MANYRYPDPLATHEEKIKDTYGLQYAKFIEQEWLSNNRLAANRARYSQLEAFKNNEIDEEKYKHMLGMCDDRIWTGMNWAFTPIAPKFVNVIKDGFPTDLFEIQAKAVDTRSQKERKKYREKLENDMLAADFDRQLSLATGTDYTNSYVPESKEEIDIHMQLKYKQPREIASEIIVNKLLQYNNWDETRNRITEDLITDGIGITKIIPDNDYGIIIDRVDPKNFIYSYDTKSSRTKKGAFYFGEIKKYTPEEILRLSKGKITPEDLRPNSSSYNETIDENELIPVLYFCFKTTINETYKKKRNKLIRKESNFQLPPENQKSKVVKGSYEVWFEGYYIVGTERIWGYRIMDNMIRPPHKMTKVLSPYIVYELSVPSIISNIMPFCEDAHIAVLKLRHLILSAKPKGHIIDIDALTDIDLGGGVMKPAEVIKIYDQTGKLLVSSRGFDETSRDYNQIIRDINTSLGTDLGQLINVYNNAINMCYEVSGLNRVRDGSAPLNGALVGTQQLALSMSNTATKHIMNGILNMEKEIAETALIRSQQQTMYGDRFADEIMETFEDQDKSVNEAFTHAHNHRFDVMINVAPDQEERQLMEVNINNALQSGQILLSDAIDLRTIKNLKLANEFLKILIRKRQKQKEYNDKQMVREQEMARAQADIAIEQSKQQTLQLNNQSIQMKAQAEIMVTNARVEKEVEGKLIIMREQHKYDMQLKGMEYKTTAELNKFKEDAKDNRTKIQADQQSRMIYQRQNGTPPENFTQNTDIQQTNTPPVPENGGIPYDTNTIYGNDTFNEYGQLNQNTNGTEETTIQPTV